MPTSSGWRFLPGDGAAEEGARNLTRRPGGDFNPAFSPDGRHIAFSRQEHLWASEDTEIDEDFAVELYVMEADGSDIRRISNPGPGLPPRFPRVSGSPAWSRGGEAIYYYRLDAGGFEIRRTLLDGMGDVRVARGGLTPAIRADGGLAFVRPPAGEGEEIDPRPRQGQVVALAADGSVEPIPTGEPESCFAPDFDRGSTRMLCHGNGPVDGDGLLPDGLEFAPAGAIRKIDLPDRTLTIRGIRGSFPALTPAGDVLSTLSGVSAAATRAGLTAVMARSLHVSAVDGSGLRPFFTPARGVAWGAAVAGRAASVVTAVGPPFAPGETRVDIWKLGLGATEGVNLTSGSPANDALPHISADGRRIVFRSSRDGGMAIYLMDADGNGVRRLADTDARETMPALSRDGEWVAFPSDRLEPDKSWFSRKIWIHPVDGPGGRLLEPDRSEVPDLSMHPRFSPDGEWVVFTSNRAGFNDEWPLTWFPQAYGELWAVPVAGGPAVRLTNDKWEDGPNDWGYIRPTLRRDAPPRRHPRR